MIEFKFIKRLTNINDVWNFLKESDVPYTNTALSLVWCKYYVYKILNCHDQNLSTFNKSLQPTDFSDSSHPRGGRVGKKVGKNEKV